MAKLTLAEAERRSQLIDVSDYRIHLDVTGEDSFCSTSTVRFGCRQPGRATFVELAGAAGAVATLNGRPVPAEALAGDRIVLTGLRAENELSVSARIPYSTTSEGLYRFVDPADGAGYVGAYVGVDVAHQVFACFDQPDLRATLRVSVTAPEGWSAVANGRLLEQDGTRWTFADTPPIPPYLFTFVAGPLHSLLAEHRGLPLGLHCRRSLAPVLDHHADELFGITRQCLDRYAELFTEPYPFDSYDQAFVPGLNWGALENPGCVTFRDEYLFRHPVPRTEALRRATVIAHEMAHMWFGDLVTMQWWDDIWLSESFADYMGYRVTAEATDYSDAWVEFATTTKPWGYDCDQRPSTHPVAPARDAVADTDTAMSNFDGISYAKGACALRQLVAWVGDEAFRAGLNDFLHRHRFGSATASDLYEALATASGRDVHGWADAWLRTTGVDMISCRDGRLTSTGRRPHRLTVLDLPSQRSTELDIAAGAAPIPLAARLALPNADDRDYCKLRPDPAVADQLDRIPDPVARAVVWVSIRDQVRDAELAPIAYLEAAERYLPAERDPSIVAAVLGFVRHEVADVYLDPSGRGRALLRIEELCRAALRSSADGLAAVRILISSLTDPDEMAAWLADGAIPAGPVLDQDLRWRLTLRSCVLGAGGPDDVDAELERDDTATGREHAARCRAARPDPEAKAWAWTEMVDAEPSTRVLQALGEGFWQPEHRDLLAGYPARFFDAAGRVAARRGAATAKILGGPAFPYYAVEEAATLQRYLGHAAVPPVLRRHFADRLDDLQRAARTR